MRSSHGVSLRALGAGGGCDDRRGTAAADEAKVQAQRRSGGGFPRRHRDDTSGGWLVADSLAGFQWWNWMVKLMVKLMVVDGERILVVEPLDTKGWCWIWWIWCVYGELDGFPWWLIIRMVKLMDYCRIWWLTGQNQSKITHQWGMFARHLMPCLSGFGNGQQAPWTASPNQRTVGSLVTDLMVFFWCSGDLMMFDERWLMVDGWWLTRMAKCWLIDGFFIWYGRLTS